MSMFQHERRFLISYAVFQCIVLVSTIINDFPEFFCVSFFFTVHDSLGEKLEETSMVLENVKV